MPITSRTGLFFLACAGGFLFSGDLPAFIDSPYSSQLLTIRRPLIPLTESLPEEKLLSGRVSLSWMNVWAYSTNRFLIDGEELHAEGTVKYSWTRRLVTGFAVPVISQGGGGMDNGIERFHQVTGASQANREQFKRNTINVSYEPLGRYYPYIDKDPVSVWKRLNQNREYPRNPADPPLTLGDIQNSLFKDYIMFKYPRLSATTTAEVIGLRAVDRIATGNSRLFAEYNFLQTGHNRFFGGLQFKVPRSEILYLATPGWDKSLYIVHEHEFNASVKMKTGISYTKFSYMNFPYIELPEHQWVFRTSLETNINEKLVLLAEYLVFSRPVYNMGRLSNPGHMISIGLEKRKESGRMTFAVIEDIINYNNTPDVGFMASVEGWL